MQTYVTSRIEIFVERPILARLLAALDKSSATGYTVLPAVAGKGAGGPWRGDDAIGSADQMMAVICLTDPSKVDQVVETVFSIVKNRVGVLSISEVQVLRPERF